MTTDLLERRIQREVSARKMAESILENKSLELYEANQKLVRLNNSLEQQIKTRTFLLEQSQNKYKNLIQQATDLILNIDADGVIRFANEATVTKSGYSLDEIIEKDFMSFIPEPLREVVGAYYMDMLSEDKQESSVEAAIETKSGEWVWLSITVNKVHEDSGEDFYFHLVGQDITERKETEDRIKLIQKQIQKSEAKFRSAFENISLGVIELNEEKKITKAYSRFLELIGYKEEDLIDRSFDTLVSPSHQEYFLTNEDSSEIIELLITTKRDEELWVLLSKTQYSDIYGEPEGWVYLVYDISERKQLEDRLRQARSDAEKAREAEKDFLANMSHEIRTPLNSIIGMIHLLKDTKLDPVQRDYVEALQNSAGLLKSLASDVLDMSKIEADMMVITPTAFCLNKLIPPIVNSFRFREEKEKIDFVTELDYELNNTVITDRALLNQVIYNLVGNAVKFTEKGSITVSTNLLSETPTHYTLSIAVRDTGIGISEENQNLIFEKFHQGSKTNGKNYGGTGLGLSIAKNIIELLGGNIQVESTPGVGSLFTINLTLEKGPSTEEIDILTIDGDGNNQTSQKILVAEDNALNIKYISSLLDRWEMDFTIASNGREALDLALNNQYGLILMDLEMPEMNGYQATAEILRISDLNRHTPILALTASSLENKRQEALSIGMKDFISKPFTPDELYNTIKKYTEQSYNTDDMNSTSFTFSEGFDESYLQEMYGEDLSQLQEMFELFLTVIADENETLKSAVKENDFDTAKAVTHKIKPTFTMIGLSSITDQIKSLENEYRTSGDESKFVNQTSDLISSIADSLDSINQENARLMDYLGSLENNPQ